MNAFTLVLQDAVRRERVAEVTRFAGEDDTGAFSIWPRHARFMTTLVFGLARFCVRDGDWEFLAVPGGLLDYCDDVLTLSTSQFLRGVDPERLAADLDAEQERREAHLHEFRRSLHQLEEEMFRRLWRMGRGPAA